MASNFLMGGKLGDFLHAMFAVKQISHQTGVKADVYMYDIGWEFGIEYTYAELQPIMLQQDYINSLNILYNCDVPKQITPEKNSPIIIKDKKLLSEGYVDLGTYVSSPFLYKVCWSEVYSKTFDFKIEADYPWIKWNKIEDSLKGKVLIHRKYNPIRMNSLFPYKQIIEEYQDNVIFISSSEKDYEMFPYKSIPFLKVETLDQWFTCINSCFLFVSNLSSPAAMSHALDKLRIIELPNITDSAHCVGEEKYSQNVKWYMFDNFNNL